MKKYNWGEWDITHFRTLSHLQHDPSKELIHNRLGRLYWVTAGDALYVQRFARENGPYQSRNLKFLRRTIPHARTIIDIGMNVANNTMEYATWAKQVIGYEPFPDTYEMARENIRLNKNVELKGRYYDTAQQITKHDPMRADGWHKNSDGTWASLDMTASITTHNVALGNQIGNAEMEAHPNNAGHNCILTDERRDKSRYQLQTIQVNTLDNYCYEEVDIIKIDCEGYELPILQGAVQTISHNRPIVQLEIVEAQCRKFAYHPNDIWDYFNKIGNYSVYDFRGQQLPPQWERIKGVMDRFFVPNELAGNINQIAVKHPGM